MQRNVRKFDKLAEQLGRVLQKAHSTVDCQGSLVVCPVQWERWH